MAAARRGMFCSSRFLESSRTASPCLKARSRIPSYFRSKSHSGPSKRSCVRVASIGSSQVGIARVRRVGRAAGGIRARRFIPGAPAWWASGA